MTAVPFQVPALDLRPSGPLGAPHPPLPEVRLVPPGAVPAGAVVIGHVVALPAGHDLTGHDVTGRDLPGVDLSGVRPFRQLVAVPEPAHEPHHLLSLGTGLVMDRWGREVTRDGAVIVLTRREFELLEHLVTHPGRVFTRQQLLSSVWEFDDPRYAPARTVDVHVSRLRRKLGTPHGTTLESLRGVGYRWTGRVERLGDAGTTS